MHILNRSCRIGTRRWRGNSPRIWGRTRPRDSTGFGTRPYSRGDTLVESKDAEIRIAQDKVNRGQIVSELISPLTGDKKKLMSELLESVKTANLDKAFQKYLPAVMENKAVIKGKIINEEKAEVTGNKSNHTFNQEDDNEIVDIRRLAGL